MTVKAPRLTKNRLGVFYFRLKSNGAEKRISLRTRCLNTANILALQLNLEIERARAMSNPRISEFNLENLQALKKYEIQLKDGTKIRTDGTEIEHQRAMQALAQIEKIGLIDKEDRPLKTETEDYRRRKTLKSIKIIEAAEAWLEERKKKNGQRTIDAKRYHVKDFISRLTSNLDVNEVNKGMAVAYKSSLINEKQTGKTIDNKLMSLHDLFKYLIDHGLYTVDNANPISGLFVLNKKERQSKNEPYDELSREEIKTFFDPDSYKKQMNSPDLFWPPLIAAYSGMRISEATAIKASDVNIWHGISYIKIPKSKTTAGIRNVPIHQALLDLGFLEYVNEVKQAKAPRLFPHCLLINGTYSKDLSAEMLARKKACGIIDEKNRKSFHSFRVSVITELSNKSANTAQIMKIVGHKARDGDEVHLGYVRDLKDLKPVVDKIQWPIEIEKLKYEGQFKAFISNQENWAKDKTKEEVEAAELRKTESLRKV
jgi:integrase